MIDTLFEQLVAFAAQIFIVSLGLTALARAALAQTWNLPLRSQLQITTTILTLLFAAPIIIFVAPAPVEKITSPDHSTLHLVTAQFDSNPTDFGTSPLHSQPSNQIEFFANFNLGKLEALILDTYLLLVLLFLSHLVWQLFRLRSSTRKLSPLSANELLLVTAAWPANTPLNPEALKLRTTRLNCGPYSHGSHLVIPTPWLNHAEPDSLKLALAHELAHIQHRDFWHILAWRLAIALHWWNPLAWSLKKNHDRLIEFRADEAASTNPHQFSKLLLSAASHPTPAVAQAVSGKQNAKLLKQRIQRLISNSATDKPMTTKQRLLVSALAATSIALVTGCACTKPSTRPELTGAAAEQARAANRKIVAQSKVLTDEVTKKAAKVRNAASSGEVFSIEVRFFEHSRASPTTQPSVSITDQAGFKNHVTPLLADRKTTTLSYPRVLTKDRRTLEIQSLINKPFFADVDKKAKTSSVEALPVGTKIAACATRLRNGKIHLATGFMVTAIIGEELVDGNLSPVATSTLHQNELTIHEGNNVLYRNLPSTEKGRLIDVVIEVHGNQKMPDHPSNIQP